MGCASSSSAAAPEHASAPHGNATASTAAVATPRPTDENAGNAPGNPLHLSPAVSPSAAAFLSVSTPGPAHTGATTSPQLDHSLVSAALGSAAPLQDVGSATFAGGTPPFARRRHRAAPPSANRRHTTPRGIISSDADHPQPPGSESSFQSRASTVVLLTPDVLARHTASWTLSSRLGDSRDFERDHRSPPPPIRVWQEDVSRWWTVVGEGVPGNEPPPCRLSASSGGLAASVPPVAVGGADPDDRFEMPPAAATAVDFDA